MKKFIIISVLLALFVTVTTLKAQSQREEYLGLPGDNLNLYAVMKVFQESQTLEDFEKSLNDQNSRINNLDLNGDNYVDYIRIIDYVDDNVHTIVLRAALNKNEDQDVAVFTVQRFQNGSVQIQLVGDEALYGRNYIIEPIYDDNTAETPNPGYSGNRENITIVRTTTYEVASWPLIRFMYLPDYVSWHSSWYWGYYPGYWNPWRPYYYDYYYGYHYNMYPLYYGHYRHWNNYRYTRYNDFYYSSIRAYSPNVSIRIKSGNYKETYSHPEQRRDGETMYTKMNPTGPRRASDNSSGNSTTRRSASQTVQGRESNGTTNSASRRSTSSPTNRAATNPRPEKNAGTTRRSSGSVNTREATTRRSEQNTGTNTKSSTTVNNKSATASPSSSRRSSQAAKSVSPPKQKESTKKTETKTETRRR